MPLMEPKPPMHLQVVVRISNTQFGSGSLEFSETQEIHNLSFSLLAEIMARFHDLFQSVKGEVGR